MDHAPGDWHDLVVNNDANFDQAMRLALTELGVYFFPLATKQCSISAAHTCEDIELTLAALNRALVQIAHKRKMSESSPAVAI
jgi:glutamate-1-semialdehyde 2,1-aminomutase